MASSFMVDPQVPMTPEMVARRRRLAEALLLRGGNTDPIQSPWQGAARIADALFGGLSQMRADKAETSGRDQAAAAYAEAFKAKDPNAIFTAMSNEWSNPGQSRAAQFMLEQVQRADERKFLEEQYARRQAEEQKQWLSRNMLENQQRTALENQKRTWSQEDATTSYQRSLDAEREKLKMRNEFSPDTEYKTFADPTGKQSFTADVKTPEGRAKAQAAIASGWLEAKAPANSVTVNNLGDDGLKPKDMIEPFVGKEGFMQDAKKAVAAYNSASRAKAAIEAGVITGSLADQQLAARRFIADWMGVPDADVTNTDFLKTQLAPMVAATLRQTVGATQISNADLKFATAAAAGDINLDQRAIWRVMDILQRASRDAVTEYAKKQNDVFPQGDQKYDKLRALTDIGTSGMEYGPGMGTLPTIDPQKVMEQNARWQAIMSGQTGGSAAAANDAARAAAPPVQPPGQSPSLQDMIPQAPLPQAQPSYRVQPPQVPAQPLQPKLKPGEKANINGVVIERVE